MPDQPTSMRLDLYVAGDTASSRRCVGDLEDLLVSKGIDKSGITVIDLFDEPDLAIENDILAIPTLVRQDPEPAIRIIGDLSDGCRVWNILKA